MWVKIFPDAVINLSVCKKFEAQQDYSGGKYIEYICFLFAGGFSERYELGLDSYRVFNRIVEALGNNVHFLDFTKDWTWTDAKNSNVCSDCNGTGRYVGALHEEVCKTCNGKRGNNK